MPRRKPEWYLANNLPVPETFEKKNYNWYVQRGMVPPSHLKVPKVIKDTVGNLVVMPTVVNTAETTEQIEKRIKDRFDVFDTLVDDVIEGSIRGLIVSGPPGMGKSYPVEKKLMQVEESRIIRGHASAKGLYELLYQYKNEGAVIVLDDADSIFGDEKALNLLKSALDTTEERVLSWVVSGPFGGEAINDTPTSFLFEGSVIFITNLDFDGMIAKGNKIAKHLEAIISRTHYVDLMMKSQKDCVVRIKQVCRETAMLGFLGREQLGDTIAFIENNLGKLREVSLRTALKVGMLRKTNTNWEAVATITCCRN